MKQLYFIRTCLFLLVLGLPGLATLEAKTITVTSAADNGMGTLRQAITQAVNGDEIVFSTALNGTPIVLNGQIFVTKSLTITGNGEQNTLINGNRVNRIFEVRQSSTVSITDVKLYNGITKLVGGAVRVRVGSTLNMLRVTLDGNESTGFRADMGGGGISNAGTLSLMQCTITNNKATGAAGSGGGILNRIGGTLTVMNTMVNGNTANRAGGGIEDASGASSAVTISGSRIARNVVNNAPGNGGGIHIGSDGDVMITGGSVSGNEAGAEGGGIWNGAGTLTVMNTLIRGNKALGNDADMGGGGLYNNGGGTIALGAGVRVVTNSATGTSGSGGGVLNNVGATLTVTDATISGNTANRAGGGIEDASGTATVISNATIDNNIVNMAPGNGGGIHQAGGGDISISGGSVSSNSAGAEGGGVWIGSGGTLTLTDRAMIRGNEAKGDDATQGGGGIYHDGDGAVSLDGALLARNKATGASGSGGGVLVSPGVSLSISNTRIIANEANRAGGGIEDASGSGSDFLITDSEIARNIVYTSPGNGGGIHVGGDGELTINGGSVKTNRAGSEGGGIWTGSGVLTIDGTEISANEAMGDAQVNGGGGIYNSAGGSIFLNAVNITNNRATGTLGGGGGIDNQGDAALTIFDSRIEGNEANGQGGGIKDFDNGLGTFSEVTNSRVINNIVNDGMGCGGGIYVSANGEFAVTGGSVSGNSAGTEGGGIWNGTDALLFVQDVLIRDNVALGDDPDQGGGGVYTEGLASLVNVDIINNRASGASGSGGGIINNPGGTLNVADSRINSNTANRAGGGIEDASGAATKVAVNNTRLEGNRADNAPGNGGGVHITGDGDFLLFSSTVIRNSAGQEGGGLWNGLGTMEIDDVIVQENVAEGNAANNGGGGLFNIGGDMVIIDATIRDNKATGTAGSGGGLLSVAGSIDVSGSLFTRNTANRAGGGVEIINGSFVSNLTDYDYNDAGSMPGNGGAFHVTGMASTVDFTGGYAKYNTAANEGGGIWNQSGTMMSIREMEIAYNTVTDAGTEDTRVGGGGVFNNGGILDIEATTVAYNTTTGEVTGGGGIANNTGGTITLMRSTVSNNAAGLAGGGIGNDGTMEIVNTTITRNQAPNGGGFAQARANAMLTITGSIVADNEAALAPDFGTLEGMVTSGGYNLIGNDDQDQFPATDTDIEGQSADLMALADNGGMTMTHAPNCGSPAIDAGDPDDVSPDQIGQSVFGDARDIGSFEKQSACGDVLPAIAASSKTDAPSDLLAAFPNPVNRSEMLSVRMPERFTGDVTLRVIDTDGRVMSIGTVQSTNHRLDLSGFAPGAYTLQAVNGEQTETLRFVITR